MSTDSCKAGDEEVESHASVRPEDICTGQAQPQAPTGVVALGQEAFFQSMVDMIRQLTGAIPHKSPIEKIREYGAEDFNGRKDDDPLTAEYFRTIALHI